MDLHIGYPGNILFAAEDIELHRQECAALIGPNGTGKTTFLRTILEEMAPIDGKIKLGASLKVGYFAQVHEELNPDNTVLDEFLVHQAMPVSEARNFLARYLFRGDEVYNKVGTLSGGELARLALALLALENANFLLLDEPTNHLDIPAQEALQLALEAYGGTILLVSHDRYLINRMASQIWELRDGELRVYGGGYQSYLEERERASAQETEVMMVTSAGIEQIERGVDSQTLSKNALRRQSEYLQALEDRIHDYETRLAKMGEELQVAAHNQNVAEIRRVSTAYADTEAGLAALLQEWELAHDA
jgi:ATP-binding cassette subfamily F protein 3